MSRNWGLNCYISRGVNKNCFSIVNMKKEEQIMFKKILSITLSFIMIIRFSSQIFADDMETNNKENVIEYRLDREDTKVIPRDILLKYSDVIEEIDGYIIDNYGFDAMVSTDDNFSFEEYYKTIKLGVILDVKDKAFKENIKLFVDELDKIESRGIIQYRNVDETPTTESSEILNNYDIEKAEATSVDTYDVDAAVEYAHEWSEEGEELSNPNKLS